MILDVLAVAPHPDDIELSAGGTVAALVAAGFAVGQLDLTAGELATRGTPEIRRAEAEAAAAVLGTRERRCLALPDGRVSARDTSHLAALVGELRRSRPRLVITMHGNDDHPDHIEGAELVRRAVYLAGLRNYPDPGAETHRTGRILFAMGRRPFDPDLVVDVSTHIAVKRRAIAAFRSQFHRDPGDPLTTPISDPEFLERVEARDRTYGARIGVTHGEPFTIHGNLGIADPALLVPEAVS